MMSNTFALALLLSVFPIVTGDTDVSSNGTFSVPTDASVASNSSTNGNALNVRQSSTGLKLHRNTSVSVTSDADGASNVSKSTSLKVRLASTSGRCWRNADLIFPPTGYGSVACLGMADAFISDSYCIHNILGSSGGAASAFFVLADSSQSSSLGRQYYDQAATDFAHYSYGYYSGAADTYEYWTKVYSKVLEDSGAWSRVKSRSKVALTCWKGSSAQEVVLHNFQSPTQAAQAHAAAGDPSCWARSCPVNGVWGQRSVNCADGGNDQVNAGYQIGQTSPNSDVYYYNTWWYAAESCCSTERLIGQGMADYWNPLLLTQSPPTNAASKYEWLDLR